MMVSSRLVPRMAGIVAIAAALAGCAVTKIDVDVYKGPLANHEEVQLEQMAVMTIGARPILMQLRDRLEETKRLNESRSLRQILGDRYDTCIREDKDIEEEKKFKSDDARRVNAILCLYKNRPWNDLAMLQSRARKELLAYEKAWRDFQGKSRDWKAFTDAMYPGLIPEPGGKTSGSLPDGHPLKAACSKTEKKCYDAVVELRKAYGELLNKDGPGHSAAYNIWSASKKIVKENQEWLTELKRFLSPPMERFTGDYKGANWTYRFLSDERLVETHATLLFKEESDKKKEFVQSVTLIAESFRSARAALRVLLQSNLDILDTFVRLSNSESVQNFRQRSDLARLIFHLIGWNNVRAIVKSVQEKPKLFSQELRKFAERAATNKEVLSGFRENFPDFEEFLLSELTRNSLETASALREADRELSYPFLPTKEYKTKALERLKPAARREFGLARVIQKEEEEKEEIFQTLFTVTDLAHVEKLQKKVGAASTGLDRGRLNDGLETMIEDYLEQDERHKMHDVKDASSEAHRLRDALVRFAQKILFVANYDNLLSGDNQKKKLLEYVRDYTGGFVTQPLFKDDERVREYTQVLQAVGNSILNQADELTARETHRKSLENGATDRARHAIIRVLDRTPQQTIDSIVDGLVAELDKLKNQGTAEKSNKTIPPNRLKNLETAIMAINEVKANVIDKISSEKLPDDPSATFLLLKTTVVSNLQKSTTDQNNGEVTKWQTTLNELDRRNPPMNAEIIGQKDFKKDKTSREVLDRLISVLEYERIAAIREGGTSGRTTHITDALDAAYKSRTRLAFIRPASSYLRSSNPAASLQNDPGLGWRNELARHSLKSLPVLGEILTRWMDKPDISPEVLSQIDRQFWQNINSIRVGGAGRTNYVMVQDDIGNWYVKGYSADAKDIVKSTIGLGQFALGRQLVTDLVNRPAPGTGSVPIHQPTALEEVFEKHKAEYERTTAENFKEVQSALNALPSEVEGAWNEDPRTEKVRPEAIAQLPDAKVHLTEALNELKKDDPNKPEQVAQRPARIVAALRAMDRYRDQLEDSIRKSVLEETPNGNAGASVPQPNEQADATVERKKAIEAVMAGLNVVVDTKIERFLKRREDITKAYENTIVFAGEVASQAPAPLGETSEPQDNEVVK